MRHLTAAILTCVTVLLGGCGKTDSPTDQQQGADATAKDSAREQASAKAGKARDACTLLTLEEVMAVHGAAVVTISESKGSGHSSCEWQDPAKGNYHVLAIDVYWRDGREGWQILQLGTAGGIRVMEKEAPDADVKGIVAIGPVEGLGDRAVYSGLLGGSVLSGDRLIEFKFGILREPEKHFRPLAEKVIARL